MPKSVYTNLSEISALQTRIMVFVGWWAKNKKTPVPQKEIIIKMKKQGEKDFTVVKAIIVLLDKGYLRRAFTISNTSCYVQLRTV